MNHNAMIEVILAQRDGKQIEAVTRNALSVWFPVGANESFDFQTYTYRIKPEPPQPRTFCVKFEGGRVWGHLASVNSVAHEDCFYVREVL